MCAERDSNPRRPKPPRLQRGVIDHSTIDASFLFQWLNTAILANITLFPKSRVGKLFECYTYHMYFRRIVPYIPVFVALFPYMLFAQQQAGIPERIVPCTGAAGSTPCTCQHLIELAQNIINGGIFLAVFFCAILFAYAGWLYLTNEAIGEQQHAKKIFSNVILGLVILLSAWLIVDTLMSNLLKDNIRWNNICSTLGL